ncbi:MAG: PhzF family phenazine biosynthesis protein [Chloroflexi bacterium]|nr:PhzF family phenazine biosynthesis protein [Chloroflexota bacterium]MCI0575694.1 PhzF family phenazine biosynthesis protein [Chloroflexota bacterium]MCI0648036.1 PhzF family phenazine biosynthesis protein [Chloroflexota bacterium]MCI0726478.1 PhzF family phenazine biosynthesis protein [Chloroflexota bacterium]
MTKRYHFVQADVFTDRPFGGNQLAVFTDGRGLTAGEMQTLAREMNYSESTFVLPAEIPGAARRVRIFMPGRELPMAGHPTVGTTYVLASRGEIALTGEMTEATLQLGIGPMPVVIEAHEGKPQFVWMVHRAPEFGPVIEDREGVAQALGISTTDLHPDWPIQIVSTGAPFLYVPLGSLDAAGRSRAGSASLHDLLARLDVDGIYLFSTETVAQEAHLHARMFGVGIPEDPATGAAAGPMGAYAARYGVIGDGPALRFICEQGMEMGRPSQIHIEVRRSGAEISNIRIGGRVVIVGEGEIFWE